MDMIGLLTSRQTSDPDCQHGEHLERWLSRNDLGPSRVLSFDTLERCDLDQYPGLWWHHTAGCDLPGDALRPGVMNTLKAYIERGGKLFLSRGASAYVEFLGIDAAPDLVLDQPPPFFLRPGLHVERPDHPLMTGLRRVTKTYGHIALKAFCDLAWVHRKPGKGRLLATAELNGAVLSDKTVCWEWRIGSGSAIAFSGVALHLYDHEDRFRPELIQFIRGIVTWLKQHCRVTFEPSAGSPLLDLHRDSYEAARLGMPRLAFDKRGEASVDVLLSSYQMKEPLVRLSLMKGGGMIRASSPDPVAGDDGALHYRFSFDPSELEDGFHEITVSVRDGERLVHETFAPLLIRDPSPAPFRQNETMTTLKNSRTVLEIDNASGCLKGLYPEDHPFQLNFISNETNSKIAGGDTHLDSSYRTAGLPGEADHPPWFGTVFWKSRTRPDEKWAAFSNQASPVHMVRSGPGHVGFKTRNEASPLKMAWIYESLEDRVKWSFTLTNEGDQEIEIGSLYLPASFNTFFGLDGEQDVTYCRRVMMHNLICRKGSYLFAEPLAGKPPFLLLLPCFDEGFELMWHDQDRFRGRQPAWEGLLYAGIFTRAEQEERGFEPWYNGHRASRLPPGCARTFSFDLFFIDAYEEINTILVREGKTVLDPHPGMVVPIDIPAQCRVRSLEPHRLEPAPGLALTERERSDDGTLYDLAFEKPGAYTLKVTAGRGESLFHFRAIPPIEDLVKARAAFIAEHQQYRNPAAERDYALLMWDAEEKALVVDPKLAFLAGGADEPCLADPVFLSAKQIFFPSKKEIEVLENYIEHFLFRKVQSREDYGVRRWVAEPGVTDTVTEGYDTGAWTDRSFNYPHVFNIYYALYEAGKRYGLVKIRTPVTYLEMAARTALAYLERPHCLNAAIEQGNLGDRALELILDGLKLEGREALHDRMQQALEPKIRHMKEAPYPYASEYAFDTTGYEGVYWLRFMAGDREGVETVLSTILGTRGKQPFWYHYGGDVRWGWGNSKILSPDEICFNYMCGLNARVLLDAFLRLRPDPWFLKLGFAGCLAPWALVEEDGTAHDFCGWEPGRVWFDPWSSEMGLGIMPTLFALAGIVLFEPGRRPVAYGCSVEDREGVLHIEPRDGIRRRIVISNLDGEGVSLFVDTALIRRVRYSYVEKKIRLDLERVEENTTTCNIGVVPLTRLRRGEGDSIRSPAIVRGPMAITENMPLDIEA